MMGACAAAGAIRAPRENRAAVVHPPWEQVAKLLAQAHAQRERSPVRLLGGSWRQAAEAARAEVLSAALAYTRSYRDVPPPTAGPLLMAGHQSELFHPGVWFKNFALGRLAERHGGTAVNLVIDNDAFKAGAIRVPTGTAEQPRAATVLLDQPQPEGRDADCPAEERPIVDAAYFDGFAKRVGERLGGLVHRPLVHEFWPLVTARRRQARTLGACLAQARHQWEGRWGNATLELPFSRVCATEGFARFAAQLLLELPRLWSIYNEALHAYRRAHRLRSLTHPVPDLAREGEYLETPLWVWRQSDPRRRRVFARVRGGSVELTDRALWRAELPADSGGERLTAALGELSRQGVKLRTKALLTTLYARLFLSDLFLHGIGGAKYDELTDTIAERWLLVRPPAYLTLTATLHLPIAATPSAVVEDVRRIDDALRRLIWQPERWLLQARALPADAAELVRQKQAWTAMTPAPEEAKARCRAIRRINEQLQDFVAERRQELLQARERALEARRAAEILTSREYAWCLFPHDVLQDFLLAILPQSA